VHSWAFKRLKYAKLAISSVLARSSRYGRSNVRKLNPVIMSGSYYSTKSCHDESSSRSLANERTKVPGMGAQESNVKIYRARKLDSP
jgi:hypothetical protein